MYQLSTVLSPTAKSSSQYTEKSDVEYKDGNIVSSTFDGLVDMLRPGATKSFTFTFILCSRLFVKPHELLAKLCKRYFTNYDKVVSFLHVYLLYNINYFATFFCRLCFFINLLLL